MQKETNSMNNTYLDLVKQTFNFPQEGIEVEEGNLVFNGLDLKALIAKYGTPMKLSYLPKIGMQIKKARQMFAAAIKKHKYEGKYHYCYCTKSSHFSFVVEETLKHDIHLETSYAYDIEIVKKMYERRKISKETYIICNGFKQKGYIRRIAGLLNSGFTNVIPVLDNKEELREYAKAVRVPFNFPFLYLTTRHEGKRYS
jgi:arginine decarboxylase